MGQALTAGSDVTGGVVVSALPPHTTNTAENHQRVRAGGVQMRVPVVGAMMITASLTMSIAQAYAQYQGSPQESIDKLQKAQREDADRAYQRALKDRGSTTPATKADPWGGVRNAYQQPPSNSQK